LPYPEEHEASYVLLVLTSSLAVTIKDTGSPAEDVPDACGDRNCLLKQP
jgi:hypothetical protein